MLCSKPYSILPHLARRGVDWKAKQKNHSLGNCNLPSPPRSNPPTGKGDGTAKAPSNVESGQEKLEGGREGSEAKAKTFDGSKSAWRKAPRSPNSSQLALLATSLAKWALWQCHAAQGSCRELKIFPLKKSPGSAVCTMSPCEMSNVPITVRSITYHVCGCGISCAMNTFYIFFSNTAKHRNQSLQASLPHSAASANKSLRRVLLKDIS